MFVFATILDYSSTASNEPWTTSLITNVLTLLLLFKLFASFLRRDFKNIISLPRSKASSSFVSSISLSRWYRSGDRWLQ
ncbi:hypothetical protein NIES25_56230 (plasmid) [Nostoc linckia NIES-25]|nr:hypothetical protein NIES25_56230 [Nostoc linckia NIES-25]